MDINAIIASAKNLGIKLTAADVGTDLCQAWSDRVQLAQSYFERGNLTACSAMIEDANRYAV